MVEEVSVAILQYEPNWTKLKRTIISIIMQREVKVEIVVSDDGSENNFFDAIVQFMKELNFTNYKLISSEKNNGTVCNALQALENCSNSIVKLISPGDYFYKEDSLARWVSAFTRNRWDISFGDAVYYSCDNNKKINVYKVRHNPTNMSVYRNKAKIKSRQLNYLFVRDQASGASCLVNRDRYLEYLYKLRGRVIYTEDLAFKLMVYDGIDFQYFPEIVIWYEYGTGVSTEHNSKWDALLKKDYEECDKVILDMTPMNPIAKKYAQFLRKNEKFNHNKYIQYIIKTLMFPQLLYWKMKKKLFPCYTPTGNVVDYSFINTIINEGSKTTL